MSWISGPCYGPDDEPEERDEKQPRNPEPRWEIVMADSGTHWRVLRPGGNWPERKSSADD